MFALTTGYTTHLQIHLELPILITWKEENNFFFLSTDWLLSIIDAGQNLFDDCLQAIDLKRSVVFRSFDISKAFYTMVLEILVEKL